MEAIKFHDWCSRNGWFGNCRTTGQDTSEYATTELLYKVFKSEESMAELQAKK